VRPLLPLLRAEPPVRAEAGAASAKPNRSLATSFRRACDLVGCVSRALGGVKDLLRRDEGIGLLWPRVESGTLSCDGSEGGFSSSTRGPLDRAVASRSTPTYIGLLLHLHDIRERWPW
jgi:hypothetical protein